MKIYIAGPLSADTPELMEFNMETAVGAGIALMHKGHTPFIPHLSLYIDRLAVRLGTPLAYEDYMRIDFEWLRECDALLFLRSSPGADREYMLAVEYGKRIFRSVADIAEAVR